MKDRINKVVGELFTRRHVAGLVSLGIPAGLGACHGSFQTTLGRDILEMAVAQHLAVISLVPSSYSDRAVFEGRAADGKRGGDLVMRERPYSLAVAPDGGSIAWDGWGPRPNPEGVGASARIMLADLSVGTRSLPLGGGFGGLAAVSSGTERVAVVEGRFGAASCRLVVIGGRSGRAEHELTDASTKLPLCQAARLWLSGDGCRLLIGWPDWWTALDLREKVTVVGDSRGRDAVLSPDGVFAAFISQDGRVVLFNLSSGVRRDLATGREGINGVGAWSPNGRYLLVGVASGGANWLAAIEVSSGETVKLFRPGDVNGRWYVWIDMGFLKRKAPIDG